MEEARTTEEEIKIRIEAARQVANRFWIDEICHVFGEESRKDPLMALYRAGGKEAELLLYRQRVKQGAISPEREAAVIEKVERVCEEVKDLHRKVIGGEQT